MCGNTVYVYFLYLLEIIVMTSKKIINTKPLLNNYNFYWVIIIIPN